MGIAPSGKIWNHILLFQYRITLTIQTRLYSAGLVISVVASFPITVI